jgi:phosphoglycolate phosphatase-like HAD superfamily hydrolase
MTDTDHAKMAVLFDIDGTLVDSVYAHVAAWHEALAQVDLTVPHWEIHRRIGMDGSLLVDELLDIAGVDANASGRSDLAESASSKHTEAYVRRADSLTILPGGREVVQRAHELGYVVVLATSAPEDELKILRDLLDVEDYVDAVTSGEDVETAKPDGTVVKIAVERAGVSASNAVMVGDATWDAIAATKVGVRSVAVLTGGIGGDALRGAGAKRVFQDARHLSDDLAKTVDTLCNSPGSRR